MCACCVRMSTHSGCKPLQSLCVTPGQPLGCLGGLQAPCTRALPSRVAPGLALGDRHELKPHCLTCDQLLARLWAAKAHGVGLAWSLRQGWDSLHCHGDTVPPHQTCFRSMLWPDSSCPNFSWLKITSPGLVCKSEEGHKWRCLWKIALWHHLPSPLMNGQN